MTEIKIEDKPELRGFVRNVIEWSFTSLMWALWIYLFLPLLSAILWIAGLNYIYQSLFESNAVVQLMNMLVRMGWSVLVIFVVLWGWGYYNYYAFGRLNRRKHFPALTHTELGRHFGLTEQEVQTLQEKKEIFWKPLYDDIKQQPDGAFFAYIAATSASTNAIEKPMTSMAAVPRTAPPTAADDFR